MCATVNLELQLAGTAPGLPPEAELREWLEATLRTARPDDRRAFDLVVRVVDAQESSQLNGRFRDRNAATNVLAFPSAGPADWPVPTGKTTVSLGDLVLCGTVIAGEAKSQRKSPEAHWAHMVIHGTLHLLGYDHQTEGEAARMEGLEKIILASRGIGDPYAPR